MTSYAEVHLTLLIMTRMATKMNKKTQTMMCLCYHMMKKKNKATRVNMGIIKNKNRKNHPFEFLK